eukprot:129519-Hanusia_phi.AAC.1
MEGSEKKGEGGERKRRTDPLHDVTAVKLLIYLPWHMRGSPVDQDRTSRLVHSRVEELLLALGHDVAQVLFQDAVNLLVIAPLGCPLDCRPRSVHRRVGPKEPGGQQG